MMFPKLSTSTLEILLPLLLLSFSPLTTALPSPTKHQSQSRSLSASLLTHRQSSSCAYTCSQTCYSSTDISSALSLATSLLSSGQTLGSDKYPHVYRDDEGFDFFSEGPYYEFPILSAHEVYAGKSPGADRIVFVAAPTAEVVGLITHTGAAEYDGFVLCTDDE